jgi:hypothetical protein
MKPINSAKPTRGRPPTNAIPINVRLPPGLLAELHGWIADQPDKPTRAEGLRRFAALALRDDAVVLFLFRKYDPLTDSNVLSKRWATQEAIEQIRGMAVFRSGIVVPRRVLDPLMEGMTPVGWKPTQDDLDFIDDLPRVRRSWRIEPAPHRADWYLLIREPDDVVVFEGRRPDVESEAFSRRLLLSPTGETPWSR